MGAGSKIAKGARKVGQYLLRDEAGKPLVAYRGEHGDPALGEGFQTRLPSISFGSKEAANTYAMSPNVHADVPHSPRVTPAHLSIRNPIWTKDDDPFIDFSEIAQKLDMNTALRLAHQHANYIENTNNWEENFGDVYDSVEELLKQDPAAINKLYMDAYPLLDDPEFVAAARAKGYDGAINLGSGETALDAEYRIFHPSQAVSPYQPGQFKLPRERRKR